MEARNKGLKTSKAQVAQPCPACVSWPVCRHRTMREAMRICPEYYFYIKAMAKTKGEYQALLDSEKAINKGKDPWKQFRAKTV